ncbi:hypothetical protein ACJJTC_015924 [Scirpophaga incertulas]
MCRLDIEAFFRYFIVYLILLDRGFSRNPQSILMELKDSSTRTGFDDLIDSIILGDLTHSFCTLTYTSPIDLQDRDGWRMSIADHIAATADQSTLLLLNRNMVLIPEENLVGSGTGIITPEAVHPYSLIKS